MIAWSSCPFRGNGLRAREAGLLSLQAARAWDVPRKSCSGSARELIEFQPVPRPMPDPRQTGSCGDAARPCLLASRYRAVVHSRAARGARSESTPSATAAGARRCCPGRHQARAGSREAACLRPSRSRGFDAGLGVAVDPGTRDMRRQRPPPRSRRRAPPSGPRPGRRSAPARVERIHPDDDRLASCTEGYRSCVTRSLHSCRTPSGHCPAKSK